MQSRRKTSLEGNVNHFKIIIKAALALRLLQNQVPTDTLLLSISSEIMKRRLRKAVDADKVFFKSARASPIPVRPAPALKYGFDVIASEI